MKKKKKENKKLLIITSFLTLVLALGQIFISHCLATMGEKLSNLEIKAVQIERENKILAEEVRENGSLSKISQKAQQLGLVRTTVVLHLTPEVSVALK